MAPKREREQTPSTASNDDLKPLIKDKKKKTPPSSPSKIKTPWTVSEEKKFKEGINSVVKKYLWNEIKSDPEISRRGANGVAGHWIALYKKL
ncbi:uncharacterized protein I206_103979 [Kwoniella pini CBS 10737]|uniref:Myb-like domain-containing protein n=1 Tax=Kwoniella pini CBS 10737 TaxID=1296096 RepID=A0A1B9I2Z6_9TREE|nr:uncharacterized protein I206_04447 [Kwoniella pini CBS 10737]OCF49916.1 hypothetical protein I206_04447 [Kwoniella pini CBS 10737]